MPITHYSKFSMFTLRIWVFKSGVLKNVFILSKYVRRRISEAQRWQIIGMHSTGMSLKAIGRQMGYHYTVVSRLVRKYTQTNNVKDLPRSGRPRVTSDRDDRALQRLVRRMPFATSHVLKQHWLPNRRLSTRTVRNRLKSAGLKSRRVIKRPLLADRHRRTCLAWCLARRG
jgi:transposase